MNNNTVNINRQLIFLLMLVMVEILTAPAKQVYAIIADSTRLTNCESNELIIKNHTKNVLGYLYNTGNRRTIFKKPLTKINDTIYLVGAGALKLFKSTAWLQRGNSFDATGKIGIKDNKHVDFIAKNS